MNNTWHGQRIWLLTLLPAFLAVFFLVWWCLRLQSSLSWALLPTVTRLLVEIPSLSRSVLVTAALPAVLLWLMLAGASYVFPSVAVAIRRYAVWLFFCCLFACALMLVWSRPASVTPAPFYLTGPVADPQPHLIAHAGGVVWDKDGGQFFTYTNSREAVQASLEQGKKYIELDILETTDGEFVCAHTWEDFNKMTGHPELGHSPCSLAEFQQRVIYGAYHPLTVSEAWDLVGRYPGTTLVTDKVRRFAPLWGLGLDRDRLIVEVFSTNDIVKSQGKGVLFPALTLWDSRSFPFLLRNAATLVVAPLPLIEAYPWFFEHLHQEGITILAYSCNDVAIALEHLGRRVSLLYTDLL